MTSFELPSSYVALQDEARGAAAAVEPMAAEADEMSTIQPGVRSVLAKSRLWELTVPAEYGGRFERIDPLAVCVVREVLMATSAHLDALFALQGVGGYAVALGGSPDLREQWLPQLVE